MHKNDCSVGMLGNGEVGSAIARFLVNPKIKDLSRDDGLAGVEILHVCIPWSERFVAIVCNEIQMIEPKLVIIHSSVAPGTTRKIGKIAVHSPIRGVHPKLHEGIKTFVKYIGSDDEGTGMLAQEHLESLGMKTKLVMPSVTTELGKLLDTTYYGLCIAFHGEMKRLCDQFGVDFNSAVTEFNRTYNAGYASMGMPHVTRPVLYPPENGIGGHCIIPNAEILSEFFSSTALDLVLEYRKSAQKVLNP